MEMFSDLKHTNRGFRYYEFKDKYNTPCTLQKSSLATEDAIWLGVDPVPVKHLVQNEGWQEYELPEGVEVFGRMHLDREQAAVLAKQLNYFAETGELPDVALDEGSGNLETNDMEKVWLWRHDPSGSLEVAKSESECGYYLYRPEWYTCVGEYQRTGDGPVDIDWYTEREKFSQWQ